MSSEFDMSFEDFLNYDFDTDVLGSGFYSLDTQDQQDGGDCQMLELPAHDFDTFDGEARDQSTAVSQPGWTPLAGDVTSAQLSALQDTAPYAHEAGESALSSGSHPWHCRWAACSFTAPLLESQKQNAHQFGHWKRIRDDWSGPTNCPWPKCSSKATFKHPTLLGTHLANIHLYPLTCTHPGCSYKRPFGKMYELNRHIATAHEEIRNHRCPIVTCEASLTGFARKDKLLKHLRDEHENLKCQRTHCPAVVLDDQQELHVLKSHGEYECALGGCENGGASCFSYENLKQHLRIAHGMSSWPACRLANVASGVLDHTVRLAYLRNRKPLQNCATCSLHRTAEASVLNN